MEWFMSQPGWDTELRITADLGSRVVPMPVGVETERVPLADVLARRTTFRHPGLYLLHDGDRIVYVGITQLPLRVRLKVDIRLRRAWAGRSVAYEPFTVSMIRADYLERQRRLRALIVEHAPQYNGHPGRPPGRTNVTRAEEEQ